jgi:hypothetical protein
MSWKLFKAFNDKPNDTMPPADSENNVEVLQ